jgi:hypothetical protein
MLQPDPIRLPPFHIHVDLETNPALHSDADPDPAFQFDADPDPAFHNDKIQARPDSQHWLGRIYPNSDR